MRVESIEDALDTGHSAKAENFVCQYAVMAAYYENSPVLRRTLQLPLYNTGEGHMWKLVMSNGPQGSSFAFALF